MRTLALGLTLMAAGLAPVPAPAAPDVAVIVNSGSTNTTGYSISVQPTGRVQYSVTGKPSDVAAPVQHGQVTKTQARRLFHDLSAASPLAQLPITLRMRSASFGTSTYITYKGQRTPDLTAPADARGLALKADITAIAAALNLKNGPRRPAMPLTPSLPGH